MKLYCIKDGFGPDITHKKRRRFCKKGESYEVIGQNEEIIEIKDFYGELNLFNKVGDPEFLYTNWFIHEDKAKKLPLFKKLFLE